MVIMHYHFCSTGRSIDWHVVGMSATNELRQPKTLDTVDSGSQTAAISSDSEPLSLM